MTAKVNSRPVVANVDLHLPIPDKRLSTKASRVVKRTIESLEHPNPSPVQKKRDVTTLAGKADSTKTDLKYQELICRLTPEEKENLEKTLATLPDKETKIAELVNALGEPKFTEAIFYSAKLPYYALAALQAGQIDEYQFGTLQLFWSIGQYHRSYNEMNVHALFLPDGSDNPEAVALLSQTIHPVLSQDQLKEFMAEMRKSPPSEQCFFVVPDIQEGAKDETVSQRIHNSTGINLFLRVSGGSRIIPTLGMMQTALKVYSGDDAVKINPVLGFSTVEQMKKVEQRDMAIPFPGVALPDKADTLPAPWYDFTYHDFYHAILSSGVPVALRRLLISLADLALQMMRESAIDSKSVEGYTLESLSSALIDMEAVAFLAARRKSLSQGFTPAVTFWREVWKQAIKSNISSNYEEYDVDTAVLFLKNVAKKLILEKEGVPFGLTRESLREAVKQDVGLDRDMIESCV